MTPGTPCTPVTSAAVGCGDMPVSCLSRTAGRIAAGSRTNLKVMWSRDGLTLPNHLSFFLSTRLWSRVKDSIWYGPPDHVGTVLANQSAAAATPSGLARSKPCLVARCDG